MVKSRVFFCGLDKSRYYFVAASEITIENKVTKSLFSLSVFAKTIFKNKTVKGRDSGDLYERSRLRFSLHCASQTFYKYIETYRSVKENFMKSMQFEFLLVQIFCVASSNVDCIVYWLTLQSMQLTFPLGVIFESTNTHFFRYNSSAISWKSTMTAYRGPEDFLWLVRPHWLAVIQRWVS